MTPIGPKKACNHSFDPDLRSGPSPYSRTPRPSATRSNSNQTNAARETPRTPNCLSRYLPLPRSPPTSPPTSPNLSLIRLRAILDPWILLLEIPLFFLLCHHQSRPDEEEEADAAKTAPSAAVAATGGGLGPGRRPM